MLKNKVLTELLHANGSYRSGEELAALFGVSRAAIWKAVEQLKEDGCAIEAVRRRGYLLVHAENLFDSLHFEELVADCRTAWNVVHLRETDSTNTYAKNLASEGAASGTVVLADRQTAGKGRLGKQFHSPEGGLYMSVILRPDLPLSDMMAVTACTASAVHQGLQEFGILAQIKWVNDLFLNGRKICGILSEGCFHAELSQMEYLVIGIGVNLRPDSGMPEELRSIVTDLQSESGIVVTRTALMAAILRHLERYIDQISNRTFLDVYSKNSCTLGHYVQVRSQRGDCTALAVGFAEDAALIVEHPDGTQEAIRSGTALIVD